MDLSKKGLLAPKDSTAEKNEGLPHWMAWCRIGVPFSAGYHVLARASRRHAIRPTPPAISTMLRHFPTPRQLRTLHAPHQQWRHSRRLWSISAVSPLLLAPLVFTGLTLTLWSYKCLMMILFQSRIIYMPGIPLGARREKISDYAHYCRGINWREGKIAVADGTILATATATRSGRGREMVVVYFQG